MTNASSHEMEQHQFSVRWWQQQADEFWRRYTPMRSPKTKLTRDGLILTGGPREYQYLTNDTGNWWQ
jgi:hypothetical protein